MNVKHAPTTLLVNMVLNVHRNRLIRDGEKGGRGFGGGGGREIIYLSLDCHHHNDFCIKTGSDESHFNVSVGSDGQSHKTVSLKGHSLSLRSCPPTRSARPEAHPPRVKKKKLRLDSNDFGCI